MLTEWVADEILSKVTEVILLASGVAAKNVEP
jgi:hypothetical protein